MFITANNSSSVHLLQGQLELLDLLGHQVKHLHSSSNFPAGSGNNIGLTIYVLSINQASWVSVVRQGCLASKVSHMEPTSKMKSLCLFVSFFMWSDVLVLSLRCAGDRGIPGSPGLKGLSELCQASWRLFSLPFEYFAECSLISGEPGDGGPRGPKGQCRFLKWTWRFWSWWLFLIHRWCQPSRWHWFGGRTGTCRREGRQRFNWWVSGPSYTGSCRFDWMWPQFGPFVKLKSGNARKVPLVSVFAFVINYWIYC